MSVIPSTWVDIPVRKVLNQALNQGWEEGEG